MKQLWFVVVRRHDTQVVQAYNTKDAITLAEERSAYTDKGARSVYACVCKPECVYFEVGTHE